MANKKGFADKVLDYVTGIADLLTGHQKLVSPLADDQMLEKNPKLYQKAYDDDFDRKMAEKGMYRWSDNVYREGREPAKPTSAPTKSWEPSDGFELENRPEKIGDTSNGAQPHATLASVSDIPGDSQKIAEVAKPIFDEYGIPLAVGMGMFGAEGRLKGLGANRNNFFNINAVDSNPNAANSYATPEEGIRAYAELLSKKYAGALKEKDPKKMIQKIEQLGYAGDPSTYEKRTQAINPGTGKKYKRYSEFVMSTPEFQAFLGR